VSGSASAFAYSHGIAGYSGQSGPFCNVCHSGASAPQVTLSGPGALDAGDQATYTLTITGGAGVAGGLDVAVSGDATLQTITPNTVNAGGDITHTMPRPFSGGSVAFDFSMRAGTTGGPLTLYAAGNSVNGDGTPNGDRAATTTLTVVVNAGSSYDAGSSIDAGPPDAGAVLDAGGTPPDAGTVAPDAGSSNPPPDAGTPAGPGDAGDGTDPGTSTANQDLVTETGCAAAGGTPLLLLAALALLRLKRRSAKRASPLIQ
jgi:hypothetical protein